MATLSSGLRRVPALLLLQLSGCGEGLFDEEFRGEVQFSLTGEVVSGTEDFNFPVQVRVAVFWNTDLTGESFVEQRSAGTVVQQPSSFSIPLVETPRENQRLSSSDFAVGFVAAYEDRNRNGIKEAGEVFFGTSAPVLVWAARALSADETPLAVAIDAGFRTVRTPLLCDQVLPRTNDDNDCGAVPFHAPCQSDAQCSGERGLGACLAKLNSSWPNGACGVEDPNPELCRPSGAALFLPGPEDQIPGQFRAFYVRACETDAECARGVDNRPYSCDPGLGGCVPTRSARIRLTENAAMPPLCIPEEVPRPPLD